jgi:hypothetical protein
MYRQINGNGAQVIIEKCTTCDRVPDTRRPFISKSEVPEWESLPLLVDNTKNSEPCAVKRCNRKDTEEHHFAPKALFFDEAYDYPTAWLCQYHHDHWHEVTKTGKWTKRKK